MSDRVLEALQRVLQNRKSNDFTVDGYTGFLFLIESVKELDLAVGKEAYAIIKATSVMVGVE